MPSAKVLYTFEVPAGAERFQMAGDAIEEGQICFRDEAGRDYASPVAGTFGGEQGGPFWVEETSGRSFEVYAANAPEAALSARVAAATAGFRMGRLLHSEQIEAGKWEVSFENRGMLAEVPPLEVAEANAYRAHVKEGL